MEGLSEYIHYTWNQFLWKNSKTMIKSCCKSSSLPEILIELAHINDLEMRLISLKIPIMKILTLPKRCQSKIKGSCVNAQSKLSSDFKLLPQLADHACVLPMKLKRKLMYRGHHMFEHVWPHWCLTLGQSKYHTLHWYWN